MAEKYLLDSNIFITPHRLYYPFDFAEGFWNQLERISFPTGSFSRNSLVCSNVLTSLRIKKECARESRTYAFAAHSTTGSIPHFPSKNQRAF